MTVYRKNIAKACLLLVAWGWILTPFLLHPATGTVAGRDLTRSVTAVQAFVHHTESGNGRLFTVDAREIIDALQIVAGLKTVLVQDPAVKTLGGSPVRNLFLFSFVDPEPAPLERGLTTPSRMNVPGIHFGSPESPPPKIV